MRRRALLHQRALTTVLGCAASASAALVPGATRTVGSCIVARHQDMLRLERACEPGNVQSEWDLAGSFAPDYAGTMARMARESLEHRVGPQRVLLLGLGGGTIAADILCGGGRQMDWRLHVTAVEADADVADAATQYFLPLMFDAQHTEALERRLRIVVADAIDAVSCSAKSAPLPTHASLLRPLVNGDAPTDAESERAYDVIIEDFAYEVRTRDQARDQLPSPAAPAIQAHLLRVCSCAPSAGVRGRAAADAARAELLAGSACPRGPGLHAACEHPLRGACTDGAPRLHPHRQRLE